MAHKDHEDSFIKTSKIFNAEACSIGQNYYLIKFISAYMKERGYMISWHDHSKDVTKIVMHIHEINKQPKRYRVYTPVSTLDRFS